MNPPLNHTPLTQAWADINKGGDFYEESFLELLREGQLVASIEYPPDSNNNIEVPTSFWEEFEDSHFDISARDSKPNRSKPYQEGGFSICPWFVHETEIERLMAISEYIVRRGEMSEPIPDLSPVLDPNQFTEGFNTDSWVGLQKKLNRKLIDYVEAELPDCKVFIEHENWLQFCEFYGIGDVEAPPKKSGVPERHCWSGIWKEATRLLIKKGPYKNKERFARQLNIWASKKYGLNLAPKTNTISKKISELGN